MSSMNQCVQSERNGLGLKERIMKRANDALGRGNEGYGIANAGAGHSALESQNAKRPCPAGSFGNEQSPDRPAHTKKDSETVHGSNLVASESTGKHPLSDLTITIEPATLP
jgi:hypothetical protein